MKLRPDILLHPNIPKPLHGLSPRTIKGQEWWDINRKSAYQNAGFCCQACGIPKSEAKYHQWLEAHELYEFDYEKGVMKFVEIVALCHSCHNFIHSGRMKALVDKGEMEPSKRLEIIEHGKSVLRKAKLRRPASPDKIATWSEWRLEMDGKQYKSKFKHFGEWIHHYHGTATKETQS